jgi:hypothetical protein
LTADVLHAELHGKPSSDLGDDAARRADVLTSTVFDIDEGWRNASSPGPTW